jgi:hypothetical protein
VTRRRLSFLALGVLALVLLGASYTAYWRYVAGELASGIDAWAENERALGHVADFAPGEIEGFPFAFRRDFAALELGQPAVDGELRVTATRVTATMRPWNLQAIAVSAEEPVQIELLSVAQGQSVLSLGGGTGEVRLRADGRLERAAIRARGAALTIVGRQYVAKTANLAIDLPALTPRSHQDPLLGFDLAFHGLGLPVGEEALTAGPIALAAVTGAVKGPVAAGQPPRVALAQWAEAGGTVELSHFAFAQAPLDLEGEGTLALDRDLQLLGALTLRAQGLTETIDLLAADGRIPGNAARTGRMMAEGLAKKDEQGRRVARVAISLQQSHAWLGPIRLFRLPILTW